MIHPERLRKAIEDRSEEFSHFDEQWRSDVAAYALKLRELGASLGIEPRPPTDGSTATASPEVEGHESFGVPFGPRWQNHEEARRWAIDVLRDRVVFAADGSQILPGRGCSVPIAAVQVAWFENWHTSEGRYEKDARFEIIAPGELMAEASG